MPYDHRSYPFIRPPGLDSPEEPHRILIVGAGPIGLAMALELANHGVSSTVLDDNNVVSVGSRAICWSKRSLEILDRLGVGERCLSKGVTWKVGRTYCRDEEVFSFDLLPEEGHKMPAFVNLQQYYVEEYLIDAARSNPLVEIRFSNRVSDIVQTDDSVRARIETPEGSYDLEAEYLIACDGAKSSIRERLGLDFDGELFEERFLIADIELDAELPSERRFWFEPTFHSGQSALLHRQPDNIYRIDLQLGWGADPDLERKSENVIPRLERVVGHSDFRVDWVSVYTFQCRRLRDFVHGRIIFAGDSAHIVSPFGARGGNSGLQDVDALGWRLAAVLNGWSPEAILDDYNSERTYGADENLLNSSRATKFMTPAYGIERLLRDQVLALAAKAPFARAWVNSGRLSVPCVYPNDGADDGAMPDMSRPGSVAPDAPLEDRWLLNELGGCMVTLALGCEMPAVDGADALAPRVTDILRDRYLGIATAAVYLIRPDQVIAARWPYPDPAAVKRTISGIWRRE